MLGWITFCFIILWISLYGWSNSIPLLNWRLASSQKMAAFPAVVTNLFKTKTYYVMHVYLQNNYNTEILVTRLWYQDLQRFVNPVCSKSKFVPNSDLSGGVEKSGLLSFLGQWHEKWGPGFFSAAYDPRITRDWTCILWTGTQCL